MSNYSTEPFNVITLPREDFDRIGTKPSNYLFFVLEKIVKDGSIIDVYSLYKGNVQVGVGDIIQSLPDQMRASNGGFRASAFAKSESKPAKPRESDFDDYHALVNSRGTWQSRPDNLGGNGQIWVSLHWFTGSPAEALDTGDEWTDPVRLTGLNGADGRDGINGTNGRDGLNGADGKNGKDGADGTGVFIRFNSAASMPDRPTGIGIDGGWGSVQKADSRWISMKQGKTASEGTWGEPVQIKCNLIRYDSSDGTIRDEFGNLLGLAFSPVYTIDTEQVIPLTIYDRYKFDTSSPLRVNCYVSTPQGTRALLNPEDYTLMCKVRDIRNNPIEEKTFELEYANKEWMLPLEEWYDRSNETDFIELHLFAKNGSAGDAALAIKHIQLVRDGEAGKITSVKAETLAPGAQATVRNEGDEHDARLVFGIPRGDKGEKGDTGKDGYAVFYTTAAYDTAQAAQISRQFIRNEGRTLQVGDFLIEASANKRLFRISQLTNDYAYCDHIGTLRGKEGTDGAAIYYTTGSYDTEDEHYSLRTMWIQTFGRPLKVGDLIIESSENKYLWQVESIYGEGDDEHASCVNRGRLKGNKGDKGNRGEKGEKGDKGDPFMVRKTYTSVDAMNAGYSTDGVPLYGMVLIDTGNVEDEDNAKLYMKGDTAYTFLTDLSGAQGIKGDTGYSFRKGEVASVTEDGTAVFTTITPSQGLQAGDIIVGFSGTLGLYGQLYRITDAAALTATDLGLSIRGPQGIQGNSGPQGVPGIQGKSGFGMYRTAASMTDTDSDYSLQKSEVDTHGRVLQVGDFIIEGSENSYLWRVKAIPEGGTSVQCGYICSLRGTQGERGPQGEQGPTGATGATGPKGATGAQGLGTYRIGQPLTNTSYSGLSISTYFPSSVLNGRILQAGDLFIEASVNSYMYRITSVSGSTFSATRLVSLRGNTGAAGPAGADGKDAPTLDRETAWAMIRSLGDAVCLSTSNTDRIKTSLYARGGTRNSSEEAVAFLIKRDDGHHTICIIGQSRDSVIMKDFKGGSSQTEGASYCDNNNIWVTGEELFINLMNLRGSLQENFFEFLKNGSESSIYRTIVLSPFALDASGGVLTAAAQARVRETYFAPLLVAAACRWKPKDDSFAKLIAAGGWNGNSYSKKGNSVVTHSSTGVYLISYDDTASEYELIVTPQNASQKLLAAIGDSSTLVEGKKRHYVQFTTSSGTPTDTNFSFMALGL